MTCVVDGSHSCPAQSSAPILRTMDEYFFIPAELKPLSVMCAFTLRETVSSTRFGGLDWAFFVVETCFAVSFDFVCGVFFLLGCAVSSCVGVATRARSLRANDRCRLLCRPFLDLNSFFFHLSLRLYLWERGRPVFFFAWRHVGGASSSSATSSSTSFNSTWDTTC